MVILPIFDLLLANLHSIALILLTFLIIIYSLVLVYLAIAWEIIPTAVSVNESELISCASIIIPIRNEEENLDFLLEKLIKQEISRERFEIIFINDHSTDSSVAIIEKWVNQFPQLINLLHLGDYSGSPKKGALKLGIAYAKHEIIITTDGDCVPDSQWVKTMVNSFQHDMTQLVIGPVGFFRKNLFDAVQWVEFSALVGITAVSANGGWPMMGNGANLAFRKSAYYGVGGYDDHLHIASGDDEFLVKSIHQKFGKGSVAFIKAKAALVKTKACANLNEFYNQRVRWASKWRLHKDLVSIALPIFIFIFYLLIIVIGVFSWLGYFSFGYVTVLLLVKFSANILFVSRIGLFFSQKHTVRALFVAEILYPFYTIIIGISALFGRFQWKQRRFK
jgi:cellulose synthase/poly-beta-1,6-N-acetylglucosamine synthase-like glycosyltransferase